MLCACIDTSGRFLALGLVADEGPLASVNHPHTRQNACDIASLFRGFIEQSGYELGQLTHFAVGTGPGTFIGTRTGIAFANGFAVSRGLPLVPVGTLRAVAAGALMRNLYPICVRSARRNSFYCGIYETDVRTPVSMRTISAIFEGEVPVQELKALIQRARAGTGQDRHLRVLTDDRHALDVMADAALPVGTSLELITDFIDPWGIALLAISAIRAGGTVQFVDALYFRRPVP